MSSNKTILIQLNFHRLSFGSIKEANGDPNVVSEAQLTLHMALWALAGVRMHQFRVFRGAAISRGAVTRGIQGCDQPWRWGAQPANSTQDSGSKGSGRSCPLWSMKTLPRVVEVVRQSLHDMSPCQAEHHWPCNWKHNQRESIDASVALPPRRGSGALGPTSSSSA
jgi:hypothetical protein